MIKQIYLPLPGQFIMDCKISSCHIPNYMYSKMPVNIYTSISPLSIKVYAGTNCMQIITLRHYATILFSVSPQRAKCMCIINTSKNDFQIFHTWTYLLIQNSGHSAGIYLHNLTIHFAPFDTCNPTFIITKLLKFFTSVEHIFLVS